MTYFALSMLGEDVHGITGALAPFDVDGDGDLDLVIGWVGNTTLDEDGNVVGPETPIVILANDGDANFTDVTASFFPGGAPTTQMTQKGFSGDFNGDGRLDLYMPDLGPEAGDWPGGPGNLLLSSGLSSIVDGSAFLTGESWPTHDLAIGDIDDDGDDDVMMLVAGGPHHVELIVSDPVNGMTIGTDRLPFATFELFEAGNPFGWSSPICAEFLDVDGDLDLDLVLPTTHPGGLDNPSLLVFNDGEGNFEYGPGQSSVLPFVLSNSDDTIIDTVAADFDSDGDLDMIFSGIENGNYSGPRFMALYESDGAGGFTVQHVYGSVGILLNAVDINNDGYMDVVADSDQRTFLINDGSGHFIEIADLSGFSTEIVRFTATDLNNDGRTDFVGQVLAAGGDVAVWLGQDQPLAQSGDADANSILGDADDETLFGLAGNDVIFAAQGADALNGGAGADYLNGGVGDDTYYVDSASDVTSERAGAGYDTVRAGRTWTLATNIEQLILLGSGDLNGTGNGHANRLYGTTGNNTLNGASNADRMTGYGDDDTYIVDNVGDVTTEAASGGVDTVRASLNWTLAAEIEQLVLTGAGNLNGTGNALANTITGNSGVNILNGGAGTDMLVGGAGDDTYYVDNIGDVTTEGVDAGTDTVYASRSWAVSSNIEKVVLTGTGDFNVAGNGLGNILIGNSGDNWINGTFGKDRLTGGGGHDSFIFNRTLGSNNIDTVTDFSVPADVIRIDDAVFTSVGAVGGLATAAFYAGAAAHDADDRIIYNSANGRLYFDVDGTGATAQVQFATLGAGLAVTHLDFIVI